HATLASAHVLWEHGQLQPNQTAHFHTKSGVLTAMHSGELIELNFPATRPEPCDPPSGLSEAIGVATQFVGKSKFDYLVDVADEDTVRAAAPNFGELQKLPVRGVMITAPAGGSSSAGSNGGVDFVSRFFAPAAGVNEDPVTGSAHCCLTPY